MSDRRFEERIAELEAEAAESEANAAKWAQESIDFESELTRTKSRLAEAEKERDALSARVRELEEILRPFAEESVGWHPGCGDSTRPVSATRFEGKLADADLAKFTVGDLRRAARALKGGA